MGWSNGTYSRIHNWTADEAAAIDIEASRMDAEDDSIETGINTCLTKDGQNEPTTNLPMGGNKHTGVGNSTALTDYASSEDIIDQHLTYYVDSGSANTYAITPSPAIAAYAEGQRFVFRATNANTGASTLNVNALGAFAIQANDGTALSGDEIIAGGYYEVVYDANSTPDRWVLMSPSSKSKSIIKFKDNFETVTSSTTLQNDDDLIDYSLTSSKNYRVRGMLFCGQTLGDLKFKLNFSNVPSNFRLLYRATSTQGDTEQDVSVSPATEMTITTMTDANNYFLELDGTFTASGSGGDMDFQWAQNSSSVNDTTLFLGSWLEIEKLD